MPFQMRVQPIEAKVAAATATAAAKPAGKSRLKRLFERQFPGVLRISAAEKLGVGGGGDGRERDEAEAEAAAIEPSSVCLDNMVQSFMEEAGGGGGERAVRCGRNRCNCFHGNCTDSSDDEPDLHSFDPPAGLPGDASEILKGLVPCASVAERNLLADASKIVEKNGIGKGKADCRQILTDELQTLGYDASICKSRWDKSRTFPAGEYEYVDVIVDGERLLVDVDFRSEFEIARSTKAYRTVLQSLPFIFVGKADRLQQIVAVVSEGARQSLKKKGLSFPPWRQPDYMRAKWLAPYHRSSAAKPNVLEEIEAETPATRPADAEGGTETDSKPDSIPVVNADLEVSAHDSSGEPAEEEKAAPWQPPAVKPKAAHPGGTKVVTGLASVLGEEL